MKKSLKIPLWLLILVCVVLAGYFTAIKILVPIQSDKSEYASLIRPSKKEYSTTEGGRTEVFLIIKNKGKEIWNPTGQYSCFLSYHLLDESGQLIQFDNQRFQLPETIGPDQEVEMTINIRSPLDKGKYILEFDMVREGLAWFKDYGSPTVKVSLLVKEKEWPADKFPLNLEYGKYTKFHSSVDTLNKICNLIRLTLNQNEVTFKGKTGNISGFAAGKNYPQIWLRDANTIIPVSRYLYDKSYLSSWLEEHLSFQGENGSLEDWIDSRGESDKNTTATDQEVSAVQAAYQISEILGIEWLEKTINGEKIIERLEKALLYILQSRWSKEYGLLIGAHTADWGDVDMVDSGQEAIYVDDRTHWTADIYDQSMFYQACLNLAEMFHFLEKRRRETFWKEKAQLIQKNSRKWLWQEDRGFFRIHIHMDSLRHDFNEDDIFATGGNTQAILSGLVDEGKSHRIIQEALKRQETYGISSISGTLLPPYPKNFFKHPLLNDAYDYQNGGQWDWFGGRFIHALFENGYCTIGREKLIEVIQKNIKNRGFFEWDNKEGVGKGSDYFAGSAGSLGKAIFEGYFGIRLERNSLSIEPKLGRDSAKIHVYQPSNDLFVAYEYNFEPGENGLSFNYNSNFNKMGLIRIFAPWQETKEPKEKLKKDLAVKLDGKDKDFWLERRNNDLYIVIETDFKRHNLKISRIKKMPLESGHSADT